ncbi:MAG TPA: hypothetical protein VMU81_06350 [Acetobacteraceae bacterium]|jgi:agmatinase|nr:hypothetical protein [Acetobacteraceae bacterium]
MSPIQPPRRSPSTFLFAEPVTTLEGLAADIAFIGVPYAQAYSYEDITNDQSNGPTALRAASDRLVRGLERYDFDLGGTLYDGKPIRAEIGDPSAHARYTEQGHCHVNLARAVWSRAQSCRADHGAQRAQVS